MKKTALLIAFLVFGFWVKAQAQQSLDEARQQARAENKLIFLDFTASWCAPCRYMTKFVFSDSSVNRMMKSNYVFLAIDVDRNRELAKSYQAYALPTFVILDSNFTVLARQEGSMPVPQTKAFLSRKYNAAEQVTSNYPLWDYVSRPTVVTAQKPPAKDTSIASQRIIRTEVPASSAFNDFMDKYNGSRLRLGFVLGAQVSQWQPAGGLYAPKMGYQIGLLLDYQVKYPFRIQPMVLFSQKTIGVANQPSVRLSYLEFPLSFNHRLFTIFDHELFVNAAAYSAFLLNPRKDVDVKSVDYGLKLGISMPSFGNIEPALLYDLGLQNLSSSNSTPLRNRSVSFSIRMIFGR